MIKTVLRPLALAIVVASLYGGFVWGRVLGSGMRRAHHAHLRPLADLLPVAGNGTLVSDDEEQNAGMSVPPADIYENVLDHVEHEFVLGGGDDTAHLTNGALSRMLASLNDPKTSYLEPALLHAREDALNGRFQGIGAIVDIIASKKGNIDYHDLVLVDVMPGSPAEKAGLRSGDRIATLDGHWVIDYPLLVEYDRISNETGKTEAEKTAEMEKINDKFRQGTTLTKALNQLVIGEGKTLTLTAVRTGQPEPIKAEVTTAITDVDPVAYRVVGDHVGYLRVRQFNPKATQEFQEALGQQAAGIKGLIVDLRDNPGGVRADSKTGVDGYTSARQLIALLTPGGDVATLQRKPTLKEPLRITPAANRLHVPLVVLVDQGTANLSEMVASALHDAGKAHVVGAHTFGDDVLQLLAVLKNGGGIEMTNAHLLTAGGVDLSKGIQPDIAAATPGAEGSDPALDRALAALNS